jgi:hypothetical protein
VPAALALVAALFVLARRPGVRASIELYPALVAAAFLVHGLAVLHADAAELERHCFPTRIGLQVAALLAIATALARRPRPVPPAAA